MVKLTLAVLARTKAKKKREKLETRERFTARLTHIALMQNDVEGDIVRSSHLINSAQLKRITPCLSCFSYYSSVLSARLSKR